MTQDDPTGQWQSLKTVAFWASGQDATTRCCTEDFKLNNPPPQPFQFLNWWTTMIIHRQILLQSRKQTGLSVFEFWKGSCLMMLKLIWHIAQLVMPFLNLFNFPSYCDRLLKANRINEIKSIIRNYSAQGYVQNCSMPKMYNYTENAACVIVCLAEKNLRSIIIYNMCLWCGLALIFTVN